MIQTENITINGRQFTRTWSDARRYVVRENIEYEEAYDPTEFGRTYIEGNTTESDGVSDTELVEALESIL